MRLVATAPLLALAFLAAGAPAIAAPAVASVPRAAVEARMVTGRLPLGGTFVVRRTGTIPVAAVELWYRVPSTGFGESPIRGLARLAAQAVASSVPITGTPLGRLVSETGGRLGISAYPDAIAISALVPSRRAPAVLKAMTAAFFAPVISRAGLRLAQRDLAAEGADDAFRAELVIRDALFARAFGSGPAHFPTTPAPQELAKIPYDAVLAFATRAFRAANAVVVVTGDVAGNVIDAAVTGRPVNSEGDGKADPAVDSIPAATREPLAIPFGEAGVGYAWLGPAITSEREATAMDFIADYLFRSEVGVLPKTFAVTNPDASVTGQFITLRNPGMLYVAISGGDVVAARATLDAQLEKLRKPLEAEEFERARAAFEYHLLSDLQTPLELADNYGWYSVEGNFGYAPGIDGEAGGYFAAARSLTPAFVASVVEKYLTTASAVVTLVPKANQK